MPIQSGVNFEFNQKGDPTFKFKFIQNSQFFEGRAEMPVANRMLWYSTYRYAPGRAEIFAAKILVMQIIDLEVRLTTN